MNTFSLTRRLNSLREANKQTALLVQRLAKLQSSSSLNDTSTPRNAASDNSSSDDGYRAELSAEVHETLKAHEDELEVLRQDIDDTFPANAHAGWRAAARRETQKQAEADRDAASLRDGCTRLEEDLKLTRIRFRRAQLQAKKNAEQAREKERQAYLDILRGSIPLTSTDDTSATGRKTGTTADLFAGRRGASRKTNQTQEEVLLNATADVTSALRRTHALLSSEVSRSRFAHETLEQSNKALEDLNTQYGTLDSVLTRSRGLLGTLVRSQKSDTWYLQTTFYLLVATVSWLVFRRLLYGPLWWFVWQPLKLVFWLLSPIVSAAFGLSRASSSSAVVASASASDTLIVHRSATGRPPSISPAHGAAQTQHYQPVGAGGAHARHADAEPSAVAQAASAAQKAIADLVDENMADSANTAASSTEKGGEQREENVTRRGDGTILPSRNEATQPANPKKRVWEEKPVAPAKQADDEAEAEAVSNTAQERHQEL